MPKKIYDIIPPKLVSKVQETAGRLAGNSKINFPKKAIKKNDDVKKSTIGKTKPVATSIHQGRPQIGNSYPRGNKKKQFPLKEVLVGGFVITLLLCIYLFGKLPKADIQISPRMNVLNISETVTADKSVRVSDFSKKIIPGQYIEFQKEDSQEFLATGVSSGDTKASGTIKIYNTLSPPAPFTLIRGTHFLSDSGKYFVTLEKITIPAANYQKGKLVAGSVDAKVQAEQPGPDSNIEASKFSIPKLNGTAYYYSLYADSKSTMTGGYIGKVKKVTNDDIEGAKKVLTKKLLLDANNHLKSQLAQDDVLLDSATISSVVQIDSSVKPNAIADKFIESGKVKTSALVFKKQDLERFVKDDILSQLPEDNNFLDKSLNIVHTSQVSDLPAGKLALNLQSSAMVYYDIKSNDMIDLLSNKSSDQIEELIDQMYKGKISELKVKFWPFWVKKSPSDINRITIKVNL